MEIKKYQAVSLEDKRPLWWLMGFVVAVAACLVALEYSSHQRIDEFDDYLLDEMAKDMAFMPPDEAQAMMKLSAPETVVAAAEKIVDAQQTVDVAKNKQEQENVKVMETEAPERPFETPVLPPAVVDDPDNPEMFRVAEDLPTFPGGMMEFMKWLTRNLQYPPQAKQNKVQGTVVVSFVVNVDGTTTDAKVVKGADATLDAEALRVIRIMPQWEPGITDGRPCRTLVHVPIVFRYQ